MQSLLRSLPLLSLLALGALVARAADTVSEKFTQTYPFNTDGVVSLSNVNGDVEIVAWDKPELSLEAEKIAANAEGLSRLKIEIEQSPARFAVKTIHDQKWKFWGNNRAEVRYKLRVPAGVSLRKIDVVNSDITVRGVRGYADLDTVNGRVEAEGLAAGGRFDTVNGSIRVSFAQLAATDHIKLDTVNGSCTLFLPANAAFDLTADSVNGRISCDFPITIAKKSRTDLTGSINGGGAKVVLDSVNGSLRVGTAK